MGYAKNYAARHFNAGTKAMALYRQRDAAGIPRCACGCGAALTKGDTEFHHDPPYEIARHSGPSVCQPMTVACHAGETARLAGVIAKLKRLAKRHAGIRRTVRHPFPCGRASRWSKPLNGIPVPRQTLAEKHAATMAKRAIGAQPAEA